jgi:hypothetical protein
MRWDKRKVTYEKEREEGIDHVSEYGSQNPKKRKMREGEEEGNGNSEEVKKRSKD